MFSKAFLGFPLAIVLLLTSSQLLWGLKWIQYYVNDAYVKHVHGCLDRLSDTDKVSPSEMTLGQSKTAPLTPTPDPSLYRLVHSSAKAALPHTKTTVQTTKPLDRHTGEGGCKFLSLRHRYPKEIISPNLLPPCKENEAFVASPAFCKQASTVFCFILVMSAAGNFNQRHGLRNLLLRSRFHMSPGFIKQYPWKYVFLVGKPNSKSKDVNEDVQRKLDKESDRFKDILQVDVLENYYNLTMKKMAAFDFLIQNNITFEILLKTDDDSFVNIQLVIEWLITEVPPAYNRTRNKLKTKGKSVSNSTKYFFGGCCRSGRKPVRSLKSKWYVSKADYKHEYFPPFCYGYGYFLSYDMMKVITTLPASDQIRSFRLEDVHTGLLVNKSGILSGEDIKNTDRIMNVGVCARGGEYPLVVMAGEYHSIRLLYDAFLKGRCCT